MTAPNGRPWVLGLDTATSRIVVAAGDPSGGLIGELGWPAGHRHGERLLPGIEELLAVTPLRRDELQGVVVGTGPGTFTGLRVGLATAKTIAHAMDLPIAGVSTAAALLRAAAAAGAGRVEDLILLLPAGPHDRVEVRDGSPARLLPGGTEPDAGPAVAVVAVDLDARAPAGAAALGAAALDGLAVELLRLGADRLRRGAGDDRIRLVPEYVTLPRGVRAEGGEIEWSHGPR